MLIVNLIQRRDVAGPLPIPRINPGQASRLPSFRLNPRTIEQASWNRWLDRKLKKKSKDYSKSPISEDRVPVIVGVGEINDRPKDIADGSRAAMLAAGRKRPKRTAAANARRHSARSTCQFEMRYSGRKRLRAGRLGITPRHAIRRSGGKARSAIGHRRRSASRAAMQRRRGLAARRRNSTATKAERPA